MRPNAKRTRRLRKVFSTTEFGIQGGDSVVIAPWELGRTWKVNPDRGWPLGTILAVHLEVTRPVLEPFAPRHTSERL